MSNISNPTHDSEMLDKYDFSQGVQDKYFHRSQKASDQKSGYGSTLDLTKDIY